MKTILLSLAVAAGIAGTASAADLGGSYKDDGVNVELSRNPFAGFYFGIQAGGEFVNIDVYDQFDGIGADGLIGGVHAGYNFASGRFVFGPYVEAGLSNVNTEVGGQDLLVQDWYGQLGMLAGYVVGKSTLISIHAAYDHSEWGSDFGNLDLQVGAVALGGGVETMVADHVSLGLKLDYLVPVSVDANGADITDYVEKSEGFRGQLKLTYRR